MSENIKPSEISEVLRMQLEGIDTKLKFDEVDPYCRSVMALYVSLA